MPFSLFTIWQQLPWVKATADQWRYSLRFGLAMCLALTIAFILELDNPSWAMTTAAVVSALPTVGGFVGKTLSRMAGTLLGAFVAIQIAAHGASEPWLFSLLMALWMAFCSYASNRYSNNLSYTYALAGYTAAIIAFSTVNKSDSSAIFDMAQARVIEIFVGILSGTFFIIIFPNRNSDRHIFLSALRRSHVRLQEHARLVLLQQESIDFHKAHSGIIDQTLTLNNLRSLAIASYSRLRQANNIVNYLLHRQLYLISLISGLGQMLPSLTAEHQELKSKLISIFDALESPDVDKYRLARILAPLAEKSYSDYRLHTFWQQLRRYLWSYIESQHILIDLEKGLYQKKRVLPQTAELFSHSDHIEAGWCGVRSFVCILIGCAFWIQTLWSSGSSGMTMIAVGCTLFSSVPIPTKTLKMVLLSMTLLTLFCVFAKFCLIIQFDELWQFLAFLLPTIVIINLVKLQGKPTLAALLATFPVLIGTFLSISNPPIYDFQKYINDSLARMFGIFIALVGFWLLQPSSNKVKNLRVQASLYREFLDQFTTNPRLNERQFESKIYDGINRLSKTADLQVSYQLLNWGVTLLNVSHIIWQLRNWNNPDPVLQVIRDQSLAILLKLHDDASRWENSSSLMNTGMQLKQISETLVQHSNPASFILAGVLWRLHCELLRLSNDALREEKTLV